MSKKKSTHPAKEELAPSAEKLKKAATTRFPSPVIPKKVRQLSNPQKIEQIAKHFRGIMEVLGLDLEDDSLAETPERMARMYVQEIFSGLDDETFPRVTFVKNKMNHGSQANLLVVKSSFTSFCEHHFVPMAGEAYVAFIPKKKLIGLSKIPRIIRFFARRPQLQERLTAQIADSLVTLLETEDVAVATSAKHYCVLARGVEDYINNTTTLTLRGEFQHNEARRHEFFDYIKQHPRRIEALSEI